jgi:hypothetical protein
MKSDEVQAQALTNAVEGQSLANYPAIFEGFAEKGVPEEEILPRENVFTFNAWLALGRCVRKGERGVKVVTVIRRQTVDKKTGEEVMKKWPRTTTVFHVSQTEPLEVTATTH